MSVTGQITQAMSPQSPASLQVNVESDDTWSQFNLFMNDSSVITQPGATLPTQVGWAVSQSPVVAVYYPTLAPGGKPVRLTVYAPQGAPNVGDQPVFGYNTEPILVSDFMSGRYQANFFLDPTNATGLLRIMDMANNGAQVWTGQPLSVGLPKSIQVELVGFGSGGLISFTEGEFTSTFASIESTVQSGPNAGQTLQPMPIVPVSGNPSYTDSSTGNVYQYALETGEIATLTATATDISPSYNPQTYWQVKAVPTASTTVGASSAPVARPTRLVSVL